MFSIVITEPSEDDFDVVEEEDGPLSFEIPMHLDQEEEPGEYSGLGLSQKQFPFSLVRKKSMPSRRSLHFSHNYNTPDDFRKGFESKDFSPDDVQGTFNFQVMYDYSAVLVKLVYQNHFVELYVEPLTQRVTKRPTRGGSVLKIWDFFRKFNLISQKFDVIFVQPIKLQVRVFAGFL